MRVLDLSFSQIPDRSWVERRVAEGVEAIFQCVWTGGFANNDRLQAVAATNLRFIRDGGAIPCIYSNAAPWRTPQVWYSESLRNAGTVMQDVRHVMVDIEIAEEGNPILPERVMEFIGLWEGAGRRVCTYSADWYVGFWKLQLGDANRVWNGRPYVHARYDGVAGLAVSPPRHPLGPLAGKQYRGTHDIEGVSVDAIVMDDGFFEEEEMPLTDDEIKRIAYAVREEGIYVRFEGTPPVYRLTPDQRLVHVSWDAMNLQDRDWQVTDLPADSDIRRLPTEYPGGVPDKMLEAEK